MFSRLQQRRTLMIRAFSFCQQHLGRTVRSTPHGSLFLVVLMGAATCGLASFASGQSAVSSPRSVERFESSKSRVVFSARASEIDSRCKAYPEINFLIEDAKGKPADVQQASVDPNVSSRGRLVIWLMAGNEKLFERINSYGIHAMRVHYANKWFSICCQDKPVSPTCRGNLRLEAATGEDFSDEVAIAKPDGMAYRAFRFVKHLTDQDAVGNWGQFLNADQTDLDWSKIIVAGSSHGSTTASRFAKHQKVARVVALCGPRDQHQNWQALPSATPPQRFFGFSHVLDGGWKGDHYCRSWEMLGLNEFGPIVNVDESAPPYQNTRRLVTDFDVGKDVKKAEKRAHSSVQPGRASATDPETGALLHEPVWKYLFTHPVDVVGVSVPRDPGCQHNQPQS